MTNQNEKMKLFKKIFIIAQIIFTICLLGMLYANLYVYGMGGLAYLIYLTPFICISGIITIIISFKLKTKTTWIIAIINGIFMIPYIKTLPWIVAMFIYGG